MNYTVDAIDACVKLTQRYISDRHLPDKAIDALDEAGSRVHISNIVVPDRIVDLEKELQRKEKALAETAALLVLQKKVQAIWGDPEDE